jgi:hypothetical protein
MPNMKVVRRRAAGRRPFEDILLDTSVLITLFRTPELLKSFLALPVRPRRRFVLAHRVFAEFVTGEQPEARARRCSWLADLFSGRPDFFVAASDWDVFSLELRRKLRSLPPLERSEVEAIRYFGRNPTARNADKALAEISDSVKSAKERFRAMHLERRSELLDRFKQAGWKPAQVIRDVEGFLRRGHFEVGWLMERAAAVVASRHPTASDLEGNLSRFRSLRAFAVLSWLSMMSNTMLGAGEKLPRRWALEESTGYDHVITSLCAYATGFVSQDIGARERCVLLNRGGFLRCFVADLEQLLGRR